MSSSEDFVTKSPEKTPTHKTKRDPLKWLEDKEKEDKDKYREKDRYKEKDRYTREFRYTDKTKEDDSLITKEREKTEKADSEKLAKEKADKEEENKKKLQEAEKLAKDVTIFEEGLKVLNKTIASPTLFQSSLTGKAFNKLVNANPFSFFTWSFCLFFNKSSKLTSSFVDIKTSSSELKNSCILS